MNWTVLIVSMSILWRLVRPFAGSRGETRVDQQRQCTAIAAAVVCAGGDAAAPSAALTVTCLPGQRPSQKNPYPLRRTQVCTENDFKHLMTVTVTL